MAKKSTSKYTASMVATLEAAAKEHGTLNLEIATEIANTPEFEAAGVTPRGVVMKIGSLGLPYSKVERTDKTGEPVMQKAEMAERISEILGVDGLESLAKAEKAALRKLLDAVERETLTHVETVD